MSTIITKQEILNYKENNPKVGYYELSKHFNLSIEELFELLDITNYKIIKDNYIQICDSNGDETYFEFSDGVWEKYEYDKNGNVTDEENSCGFKCESVFNEDSKLIKQTFNDGTINVYKYNDLGVLIEEISIKKTYLN